MPETTFITNTFYFTKHSKQKKTMLYLIGFSVLILIIGIVMYNNLISKKNNVEYAFSSIDVMLKKRHDLIPNLVASVKQYMTHERGLLTEITELRNSVMKPNLSDSERFKAEGQLSSMLGKVQIAVENYPDLKANTNFLQLQAAMNEVEEQLSAARRAFNASVNGYNNSVEMFPTNILAGMMNLRRRDSFEIAEAERGNVNIDNLFNS
jgi:LemA protein